MSPFEGKTAAAHDPGDELRVRVRYSQRAKNLRITVGPGQPPEVVVPPGTRRREIDRMVARNRGWILRKARQMEAVAAAQALGLDRDGVVWLEGEPIHVVHGAAGKASRATLRAGRLEVTGPTAQAEAAVGRWYRREARTRLVHCAETEAARLGLRPGRISVRDQRTRWGSCSPSGDLSFSWRLLLAPPAVLRYVVVHELCHLRELNHSPRFWGLLDEALPGWREQAAWLREHSYEVGAYRPRPGPGA